MLCDDKLVDTDFNLVIGKVLKEKRLEKGWSLLELSNKLNKRITRQTLFHYENGETKIRRNVFIDICNVYCIEPDDLLKEIMSRYIKRG